MRDRRSTNGAQVQEFFAPVKAAGANGIDGSEIQRRRSMQFSIIVGPAALIAVAVRGLTGSDRPAFSMDTLVDNLRSGQRVIAAELRPPRAELEAAASRDAWIDTYHAVRSLTRRGTFVFLTDSAVGSKEEDNLRHLVINLGSDVPRFERRSISDLQASTRLLPGVRGSRS